MVVTMKKLHVLLHKADRESFLSELAKVGVVHIEERVEELHSNNLEQIGASIKRYRYVLDHLDTIAKGAAPLATSTTISTGTPEDFVKTFETLEQQGDDASQKIIALKKDLATLTPWGDFDPQLIEELKKSSVTIRFFETNLKKFRQLSLSNVVHAVINEGSTVKFIVFDREEVSEIDAEEISLPASSLSTLTKEIVALEAEIEGGKKAMLDLISVRSQIAAALNKMVHDEQFECARLSLEAGAEGAVLLLTGWLPSAKEKRVADVLGTKTAWFEIRNPGVNEEPPVKMKNSAYVSKFEPITKMFSLPNYFELDPTPFFAPFFMFFYGMCLGDVGYGALVLIAALGLLFKGPAKFKNIFILGSFLGVATILNGFFLNSFFGASIFDLEGVKGIVGSGGPLPFLGSREISGKTEFPAITFAIYIGIVQMILGMILQVINKIRNQGFIYAVQPMCYIPLTIAVLVVLAKVNFLSIGTYSINSLNIGTAIAGLSNDVLFFLLALGIIPFVFFNSPQIKIWFRPLKFLWEMYNFVNGLVSNILSYLRLFALGLAGGLLGKAFNDIAFMLVTNDQGDVSFGTPLIVFTILILIVGHGLNFALSALGAYVHSVRLIFVEFYGNLSFQGGGKQYVPFTENVTKNIL